MGYSISWIAFKDKTKEQVLVSAGLSDSGEVDEANEAPISGAEFPNGWYVLFLNRYSHPLVKPTSLGTLSKDCQVLGCQIEEHVMASAAHYYDNGSRIWGVSHESDRGRYDVTVEGQAPESLDAVRTRLVEKQDQEGGEKADVDYIFDVPVELAYDICGYRHDRWKFDWGQPIFTQLLQTRGPQRITASASPLSRIRAWCATVLTKARR